MQSSRQFSSHSAAAQDRQRLEQLWNASSAPETASMRVSVWLKTIGQQLCQFLTGTQQLRIWTQDTKAGKVWRVYDPVSDQAFSYGSEQDLRVWLDQRHL